MTRMVNPSQIIVTGLPQGSSVRPGGTVGSQARMVAVSQGSLLGNQIVVQQSPSNTRVITPQQVITGGGGRPTFVTSQGGWPAAGGQLQMLRTVLTQAGSKPGQTTILLAQPSGQSGSSLVTSTGQLLQAATVKTMPQSGLKNAPLYARIITPPPGVRLVGMRANQGAVVGQVTSLQNVGMVRAIGKPTDPVSLATSNVVVTSSPADGATGTHPEQK
ncbi:hypothetical protein NP493_815g02021 [Ridgeia piscesae]|uniref:Uncharacterized protein n=1 Tax=Ridgeia piscesae TaxID=27915 RepID=A0AAD9KPI5_RIDPI|nr:hypothetical protein NP493_815g02021 [Ridgeia piscesae]